MQPKPYSRNHKTQHFRQAGLVQRSPGGWYAHNPNAVQLLLARQVFIMRGDYMDIMPQAGKTLTNAARNHAAASANRRVFVNQYQNTHS